MLFEEKATILQKAGARPTPQELNKIQALDETFYQELERLALSESKDAKAHQDFFKEREEVVAKLSRKGLIQGILL